MSGAWAALLLKRPLSVSDSTAWWVQYKLLEAMRQRASRRLLDGVVFADDQESAHSDPL
jgi:hypothetical protein